MANGPNRDKRRARRIRVCVVVASPEIIGGHSVQAQRLVRGLSGEPAVEVETLWINPRLPGVLNELKRIKYVRTAVTLTAYVLTLLVRLRSADLVHVFSASYLSFLLGPAPAVIIGRLYGKPVLLNYHSGEAEEHLARWRLIAAPIIRLASVIVVPSRFLVEVFAKFKLDAVAISNIVDRESFKFRQRRPLGTTLICNRNLEPNYEVAGTLRAFAVVEQEIPCARLIVAGDGSLAQDLRRLSEQLRLRNVEFVGTVDPAKMPSLYDSADVFVNSSVVDCTPLSILEAFSCGLPVVTTCAGGIPYLVRHNENGLLVRPGSHIELAQAILSVLRDQTLALRLIERGRRDSDWHTWEATRSQWLSVYRLLIDGKGAHSSDLPAIEVAISSRSQEAE